MRRKNWKRIQPTSISHAMELCLEYAREHNLSVDRIADRIGQPNKWTIYKWIENGRIPAIMIRPFECACGIDFITRYIAHSAHKLIIDIPIGRKTSHKELNELSLSLHETIGVLMRFYEGKVDASETLITLTTMMEDLAFHRCNVEKSAQPELDFTEKNNERI